VRRRRIDEREQGGGGRWKERKEEGNRPPRGLWHISDKSEFAAIGYKDQLLLPYPDLFHRGIREEKEEEVEESRREGGKGRDAKREEGMKEGEGGERRRSLHQSRCQPSASSPQCSPSIPAPIASV